MALSAEGTDAMLLDSALHGNMSGDATAQASAPIPCGAGDADGSQGQPTRFRSGRWFLLAEGLLVSELACAAIAAKADHPEYRSVGGVFVGLELTPARCGVLLGYGVIAILATLNRRAALVVTAMATAALLALTTICDLAAAGGVPHKWGIDPRNAVLYAVLLTYNVGLLVWLLPDIMVTAPRSTWSERPETTIPRAPEPLPASPPSAGTVTGAVVRRIETDPAQP